MFNISELFVQALVLIDELVIDGTIWSKGYSKFRIFILKLLFELIVSLNSFFDGCYFDNGLLLYVSDVSFSLSLMSFKWLILLIYNIS